MKLYETEALYQQNMSPKQQEKFKMHYQHVFKEADIKKIHDCSIGAGGTTLPLAALGYEVSGSDLSENLLTQCQENFYKAGFSGEFFQSDFREIHHKLSKSYGCIMSTGNSLPHISNEEVEQFIKNIVPFIKSKGYFYIDLRNWDQLLIDKPLFKARDPFIMTQDEHKSLYQIFNWFDDDSVEFVFVTSKDVKGKHVSADHTYAPKYYPLRLNQLKALLNTYGFRIESLYDMDDIWFGEDKKNEKTGDFMTDYPSIRWYSLLAQKID